MKIDIEKFPERLKKVRENAKISQTALSKKIYVARVTIARWESGTSTPSIEDLARLCIVLSVNPEYLLGGEK